MPFLLSPRRTWLAYALVMAAIAAVFFSRLASHPLDTHDQDYFLDCSDTLADPAFFFSPDKRMPGRPGLEILLLAQYAAWGPSAAGFHLFGVFLHLLAALSLARAALAMGADRTQALLSGLLFLVHIGHFNAVHWISAQCYAVVLICGCSALSFYLRPGRRAVYAVYALLLLGLSNHVAAAVFLPFFFYLSWRRGQPLVHRLKTYAPLGLVLVVAAGALKQSFPQAPQAGLVAASIAPIDIGRNLLLCWSRVWTTAHQLPFLLHQYRTWEMALGGVAALLLIVLHLRPRFPLSEWHTWTLLHLLPPLALAPGYIWTIPSGPSRYLYLASAGVAGMLAWLLQRSSRLAPRPHWVLVPAVLALLGLSLWNHPRAEAVSFYAAGRNYLAFGDIDNGTAQLQRAIDTAPGAIDLEDAYMRLVPMLFNRGEKAAAATLSAALDHFPKNHTLRLMQLVISDLSGDGRARQKLDGFKRAKGVSHLLAELYYHVGRGRQKNGDRKAARMALHRSLEFNPQRPQTLQSLRAIMISP
jgi:hypothetical protein